MSSEKSNFLVAVVTPEGAAWDVRAVEAPSPEEALIRTPFAHIDGPVGQVVLYKVFPLPPPLLCLTKEEKLALEMRREK